MTSFKCQCLPNSWIANRIIFDVEYDAGVHITDNCVHIRFHLNLSGQQIPGIYLVCETFSNFEFMRCSKWLNCQ